MKVAGRSGKQHDGGLRWRKVGKVSLLVSVLEGVPASEAQRVTYDEDDPSGSLLGHRHRHLEFELSIEVVGRRGERWCKNSFKAK